MTPQIVSNSLRHHLQQHMQKVSFVWLICLFLHVPVVFAVAWWFETPALILTGIAVAIVAGPLVAYLLAAKSIITMGVMSFAAISMSGALIAAANGMIEYHFHIFIVLPLLLSYGHWSAVLVGALTAAVHHLGLWLVYPSLVFNYPAGFGIVILHAVFVILQAVPSMYLARRFGLFIQAQGRVVGDLHSNSIGLLNGSAELSRTNQKGGEELLKLTGASEELRSVVGTVASASEELLATLNDLEQKSSEASTDCQQADDEMCAAESSLHGLNEKAEAGVSMQMRVRQTISEAQRSFEVLRGNIENIEETVGSITRIAGHTNMLALNATIEAASAGEAGRGFSVVAEEIKQLAMQTATATGEIQEAIRSIVDGSEHTLTAMQEVLTQADEQEQMTQDMSRVVRHEEERVVGLSSRFSGLRESLRHTLDAFGDMRQAVQSIAEQSSTMQGVATVTISSVQAVETQMKGGSALADNLRLQSVDLQQLHADLQRLVGSSTVDSPSSLGPEGPR